MSKLNRTLDRRGFTLVETVIASGLFLVATAMVISATFALQYASRQEKVQNELERNAAALVDHLQRDINLASEVQSTWGGYSTSSTCLVLEIPTFDDDEVRVPNVNEYVIYDYNQYTETSSPGGSVIRLEIAPHDSSDTITQPELRDYQVTEGVTDFLLFFDHLDFASLEAMGLPLADVQNIELFLSTQVEKDGTLYERNYTFSATTRN